MIRRLYQQYYPTVAYSVDEVMISTGATQAIYNALAILLNPGDEVLAFEPHYTVYPVQVNELGGKFIKIPTGENQFRPSGKLLAEAIKLHPKAKVLILNYPNNPTGIDLTEAELTGLAETLKANPQLAVICDDVYAELTTTRHLSILDRAPLLKERVVVINSASKEFAIPGMRIGMAAANAEWIQQMTTKQATIVSSMPVLSEQALIAAADFKLNHAAEYKEWLNQYRSIYSNNMKLVEKELRALDFTIVPGGNGMFVLAGAGNMIGQPVPDITCFGENIRTILGTPIFRNDTDIVYYFLYTAGVALVPASGFGIDPGAGFLRFSCAKNQADLQQALQQIKQSLEAIPAFTFKEIQKMMLFPFPKEDRSSSSPTTSPAPVF